MLDDVTAETFLQRIGLRKVDKELPLFGLGTNKMCDTKENLINILDNW